MKGKGVVGEVEMRPLTDVKPNEWNPNRMTPQLFKSLKHGLIEDGWLKSQSLLIWGTDDTGAERNVIIDGEHRYRVALELGFGDGPMVLLHGLSEAQAKALTIKMNQKRGEFDSGMLANLVAELQGSLDVGDLAIDLGIEDEALMKMLATDPDEVTGKPPPKAPTTSADYSTNHEPVRNAAEVSGSIKLVQLFFDDAGHEEFRSAMRQLGEVHGTKNVSDTVLATVREAVKRADSAAE